MHAANDNPPGKPADNDPGAPGAAETPQVRTLLLTDLCDSTQLVERLGDAAAAELFREHDRLVLGLLQQWRGRLIDRSDGLLLLFDRAVDGLGFALDYARGLRDIGERRKLARHDLELRARSGLHVGEVLTWRNSDAAVSFGAKPLEVEGLAKPMAGRLMTLARPGQILLSATAEPLAHRAARELGERGDQLIWKDWGRWRFKGVPQSQQVYEVGEPGISPLRAPQQNRAKAWRDIPLWRRPAALAAELALLAAGALGLWFVTKPEPAIAFNQRDWVVVGDLRNLTGQRSLDDSLEQAFRISLEQSRYVNVLSDLKARDTLQRMQRQADTVLDRAVASEIALRDGARAVILPTVAEVGGRVRVSAEVIDPHTQTTVYTESADGKGVDSTLDSIDDVTAALRGKLGEAVKSIEKDSVPLPQVTTRNLDALRAYALGQKAFGSGNYTDAKGLYASAIKLDPQFALAFIGLLRAHNALNDLAGGVPYLRSAATHRDHLPPREQFYLDAWLAQVDTPPLVLDRWRQLSRLYPDFYPAAANVGYELYTRNRFVEGLPYARRAAAARYEFAPLAWELVGRLSLGAGQYQGAEQAFAQAETKGVAIAAVHRAVAYAAQEKFPAADQAWRRAAGEVRVDRVSYDMDRGRWESARNEAAKLAANAKPATLDARQAILPAAVVDWVQGKDAAALQRLRSGIAATLDALDAQANASDSDDDAYAALSMALLAQRLGEQDLAHAVEQRLRGRALASPAIDLLRVVEANDLRLSGRPDEAVARLGPALNGQERFQAHGALLEAYAAAGMPDRALAEANWIGTHRGLAYIELGCGWCQQPLNVVDTTLAHLRAAELSIRLDDKAGVKRHLAAFDRRWPPGSLPDHLRDRRDAALEASN
jgi:putative peptide modification system cyclase